MKLRNVTTATALAVAALAAACGGTPQYQPQGNDTPATVKQADNPTCDFCIGKPPGTCACSVIGTGGGRGVGCAANSPIYRYTWGQAAGTGTDPNNPPLLTDVDRLQVGSCGYQCIEQAYALSPASTTARGWHHLHKDGNGNWVWEMGAQDQSGISADSVCFPSNLFGGGVLTNPLGKQETTAYAPGGTALAVSDTGYANGTVATWVVGRSGTFSISGAHAGVGVAANGHDQAYAYSPSGYPAAWVAVVSMSIDSARMPNEHPYYTLSPEWGNPDNGADSTIWSTSPVMCGFRDLKTNAERIFSTNILGALYTSTGSDTANCTYLHP
jgi:hypothetical protein